MFIPVCPRFFPVSLALPVRPGMNVVAGEAVALDLVLASRDD
jgi:hypothetical protein